MLMKIVPEKNFGSGMFTEMFRKVLNVVYPCTIVDDFISKGQKEKRIIDNILPLLSNHQMIFNEDMIRNEVDWVNKSPSENLQYSLMYQLTHMTYDKQSISHDDRIDSLAIACQYVSHMVIVNAQDRLDKIKETEMDKFLFENVYGTSKNKTGSRLGSRYLPPR